MAKKNVLVISIKPKYAGLIYDGIKKIEFRKVPPRNLNSFYLVYESAPVSKLTGYITFSAAFTCRAGAMLGLIKDIFRMDKAKTVRIMGVTEKELINYAGGVNGMVTALLISAHERDSSFSEYKVKPPQNWGTIRLYGDELVRHMKGGAK